MGKYFGTDGFRGEANCTLTADHAFRVGRFLGWYYCQLKRRSGSDEPPLSLHLLSLLNCCLISCFLKNHHNRLQRIPS